MNKAIHFKTSLFDVSKERKNPINPIYGHSLLDWMKVELSGKLEITPPDAEDWGWYSETEFKGQSYLIGACALTDEGVPPSTELEWVFQIEKERTFMQKILGKNKMDSSDACFALFKELFDNTPEFREVEVA